MLCFFLISSCRSLKDKQFVIYSLVLVSISAKKRRPLLISASLMVFRNLKCMILNDERQEFLAMCSRFCFCFFDCGNCSDLLNLTVSLNACQSLPSFPRGASSAVSSAQSYSERRRLRRTCSSRNESYMRVSGGDVSLIDETLIRLKGRIAFSARAQCKCRGQRNAAAGDSEDRTIWLQSF